MSGTGPGTTHDPFLGSYLCSIPPFHTFVPYPRSIPLLVHVGLLRAMLGPCWAYVGPCWAYVGPMLGQERRVHLGPSTLFLGHVGAMLGPKTMVFPCKNTGI